jgi:hypothetical protein
MMRGTGYKSSGVNGIIIPVLSQYVNYDIEGVPRPTNKNTRGYLSHKLKWLNGGYPNNVVKSTLNIDYETYMAKLHIFKERDEMPRSCCLDNLNFGLKQNKTKLKLPSYEIYQKTKLLERNCLPLKTKDLHYPPMLQSNTTCNSCHKLTQEEYINLVSCP